MIKNISKNELDSLLREVKNNMSYPDTYGFIGGCVGVAKEIAKLLGKQNIVLLYDKDSWKQRKKGSPVYRTLTHAVVKYKNSFFDYSGKTSAEEIRKRIIGRHDIELYRKKKKRMEKGTAPEHVRNQFNSSKIVKRKRVSLRSVSQVQNKLLNKNDELKPFLRHYKEILKEMSKKKKKSFTNELLWR